MGMFAFVYEVDILSHMKSDVEFEATKTIGST
jgi:hypothetical protein